MWAVRVKKAATRMTEGREPIVTTLGKEPTLENMFFDLCATKKRSEKLIILKRYLHGNPVLARFLWRCYNPYERFNIAVLLFTSSGTKQFSEIATDFDIHLQRLSKRVIVGNEARAQTEALLNQCHPKTQHILVRDLQKNLKCGIGAELINAAFDPGTIEPIPIFNVQLANTYDPTKSYSMKQMYVSEKLDGIRCCVFASNPNELVSRSGKPIYPLPHISDAVDRFFKSNPDVEFVDGELYIHGKARREINAIVSRQYDCPEKQFIQYCLFACGPNFKKTHEMLSALEPLPSVRTDMSLCRVNNFIINLEPNVVTDWAKCMMTRGYEGVVLRDIDVPYSWKRDNHLLKYKLFKECTMRVTGWCMGNKDTRNEHTFGGIHCEGMVDDHLVRVTVRAFSDDDRAELLRLGDALVGRYVDIKYQDISVDAATGEYSMSFASFIDWRDDLAEWDDE